MNSHDPKKDHTSGSNRDQSAYGYRPSDGQGYTNPDGSHGYVYGPGPTSDEKKTRRYRGAVIALSVVLVTILLSVCCLVGVYMAAQVPDAPKPPVTDETETSPGTSSGLVIDGTETGSEAVSPEETLPDRPAENPPPLVDPGSDETAPPIASINKLPPKREDRDGDGVAEIETDEDGQVLTSADKSTLTVATVVNRVAASVVEIITDATAQVDRAHQQPALGAGSGIIVSREGFIVTNYHVIEGARSITVRLSNGKEFSAKLVGIDTETDIAVLWVDARNSELTVATLGASFDLVVGEDILSIGNPLGSLGGTVTEGMVAATARHINVGGSVIPLLQISAPVSLGNSGGGLFNMAGELIGIVNTRIAQTEIAGLSFAVPVDTAYEIITQIIDWGYIKGRPALGFEVVDVTSVQTAMRYFDSFYTGVYVYDHGHDTVKYGDLILSVDGVKITSAAQLTEMIEGKSVGDTMAFEIYRDREKRTVTVTVGEKKS